MTVDSWTVNTPSGNNLISLTNSEIQANNLTFSNFQVSTTDSLMKMSNTKVTMNGLKIINSIFSSPVAKLTECPNVNLKDSIVQSNQAPEGIIKVVGGGQTQAILNIESSSFISNDGENVDFFV